MGNFAFDRVLDALPATMHTPPFPGKRAAQRTLIRSGITGQLAADGAGTLQPGMHSADWPTFVQRFGFSPERMALLGRGREGLLEVAAATGTRDAVIGGSLVTGKIAPGDIDVMTMPSRKSWHLTQIRGELETLFGLDVHNGGRRTTSTAPGVITPGNPRSLLEFFSQDHNGAPRGVVLLDLRTVPAG